jgi:hypothetical protein
VGPGPYTPDEVSGIGPGLQLRRHLWPELRHRHQSAGRFTHHEPGVRRRCPIDPAARFAVAINNYRQNGGGGFPHVVGAPILWNPLVDIRESIIDWVKDNEIIDPADVRERRLAARPGL